MPIKLSFYCRWSWQFHCILKAIVRWDLCCHFGHLAPESIKTNRILSKTRCGYWVTVKPGKSLVCNVLRDPTNAFREPYTTCRSLNRLVRFCAMTPQRIRMPVGLSMKQYAVWRLTGNTKTISDKHFAPPKIALRKPYKTCCSLILSEPFLHPVIRKYPGTIRFINKMRCGYPDRGNPEILVKWQGHF